MISRVCKELVRFYPSFYLRDGVIGERAKPDGLNRRFPLLPPWSLSSMHHHRLRKLRRFGLKQVKRFQLSQIRHNWVLGFNHIARPGSPQHTLNVARIVCKIHARNTLSNQSIPGEICVYRASHTVF